MGLRGICAVLPTDEISLLKEKMYYRGRALNNMMVDLFRVSDAYRYSNSLTNNDQQAFVSSTDNY